MGWVHQVVLENFKSYDGRVVVGPLRRFTCVVGPNGAGKSNFMEAISFVLGARASHLRGERLLDFIHRKEGEALDDIRDRTASVELVFIHSSSSSTLPIDTDTPRISFKRLIKPQGDAHFELNGEVATFETYEARLKELNILSKTRNFLVYQGDIQAALHREGKVLAALFEQVSGSIQFRVDYDRLAAEKTQKEEAARHFFARRRDAFNDRKRMAHQKEEADQFHELSAKHRHFQSELLLLRLLGVERRAEEVAEEKDAAEAEEASLIERLQASKQRQADAERGQQEQQEAISAVACEVVDTRSRLVSVEPERIGTRNKLAFARRRLEDQKAQCERDERRRQQLDAQASAIRNDLARVGVELQKLSEKAHRKLPFTDKQQREFDQVKRETARLTASYSQRARELEAQISGSASERAQFERKSREAALQVERLAQRRVNLEEEDAAVSLAREREAKAAKDARGRSEDLRAAAQARREERSRLQAEQERILRTIQDITATERQMELERQIDQVSSELVRAVPGVHGRVLKLCEASDRRLHVAIQVSLGGYLDAMVLESAKQARECIKFLKDRRLNPMTFVPLDSLHNGPPDPQLVEAVGGHPKMRLALKCLTYDERFAHAFEFLLGDVVVSETLEDGRQFGFDIIRPRGLSCRIVSLEGETISRDGNMSVSSDAAQEGATRFDFATLEANRIQLNGIDQRLYEIRTLESGIDAERASHQDEAHRFESRVIQLEADLARIRDELGAKQKEQEDTREKQSSSSTEVARLAQDELHLREEQRLIEESISQAVSGHFARLSAAMGVDDIQKTEREWRRECESARLQESELQQQQSALETQLAILQQSDPQERAFRESADATIASEAEVAQLLARDGQLADEALALEERARGQEAQAARRREADEELDQGVARAKRELQEEQLSVAASRKRLAQLASEAQALLDTRADLLRRSMLDGVPVPRREGRGILQDTDLAAGRGAHIAVDYSQLAEEKRNAAGGAAANILEDEIRAELTRLSTELEKLKPNLKAIEQLELLSQEAEAASQAAISAKQDIEAVELTFSDVRQRRFDLFMECFNKVKDELGGIYKQLTANIGGLAMEGGSAFLDLEDTEDPWNAGVKFTAMPPLKRFTDINQLSGGEKTLAAMALLFAMQVYHKPPFLVLDEVDAHLDQINVQALARYVRSSDCQTIVISLKDKFFSHSEGLVGVSKNRRTSASVVLTMDLVRFREPAQPARMPSPALQMPGEEDEHVGGEEL